MNSLLKNAAGLVVAFNLIVIPQESYAKKLFGKHTAQSESSYEAEHSMHKEIKTGVDLAREASRVENDTLREVLGTSYTSSNFASYTTSQNSEYRIGSGDLLEFLMFTDPSLDRDVMVRFDGYISLPRIGDVQVSDLTRTECEAIVEEAFARIYNEPEVSLAVRESRSKTFTVAGDVENPGSYPYDRQISLWQAIQLAGGPKIQRFGIGSFASNATGQIAKAYVIRRIEGKRKVFEFDLRKIEQSGDFAGDVIIRYDDLIYVPGGINLVYVIGESKGSTVVQLTEDMTVLKAIALAGGPETSSARLKSVALIRTLDNGNASVSIVNIKKLLQGGGNNVALMPGDIIYIPRKHSVRLQEMVGRVTDIAGSVVGLYSGTVKALYTERLNAGALDRLERFQN